MEIVRINESKLKLTLDEDDIKKYGVDPQKLDYGDTETRRLLWELLDEARVRTGFNAASDRALIEAFPGRRGGCEIYVTLLCEKQGACSGRGVVYRFKTASRLLAVCERLVHIPALGESALYREPSGAYALFLYLSASDKGKSPPLSPFSFIEEYGEKRGDALFGSYVKEYGTLLHASHAVERLAKVSKEENKTVMLEEK